MTVSLGRWMRRGVRFVLSRDFRQDALHEARRRRAGEPGVPGVPGVPGARGPAPHRVLVLCHGNLCRSPFAAALLAARAPALEVRSAGLHAGDGHEVDATARRIAERWGVDLSHHRTRPVSDADVAWAGLILGMQGRHAAEVVRRWPDAHPRTRLLGHFLEAPPYEIADPWGHPETVFEHSFERIEAAVARLVMRLEDART